MSAKDYLEWRRLQRPVPRITVHFSKATLAAALWAYGEDDLADRALGIADSDHERIQTINSHFENPEYPLPVTAKNITHNHTMALAAVVYFERALRPLALDRRRPEKLTPERFMPTAP